jgi:transitional endoplasmic reticulum ATPase
MKSKIFILLFALALFSQTSCSIFTFETEFGEFLPSPTQLTQMATDEAAQELKRLLNRSLTEIVLDKAKETLHQIGNSEFLRTCDPEQIRIWADIGVSLALIYSLIYGIDDFEIIEAITWKDVRWGGPLPKEFEELLENTKNYKAFQEKSLTLHNGYLLHGVPGTGKTFLVRALSEKLQLPLIETNSGQFLTMWQGSGNAKLKAILKKAHSFKSSKKPFACIVFIDEIDGFQRNRGGTGNGEEDRLMNDLLAAITDPRNKDILFIGATNFIKNIDEALKRDGRLVPIELRLPSEETRKALIALALEKHNLKLNEKIISMETLLDQTTGFSPATITATIEEALHCHTTQGKPLTSKAAAPNYPSFSKQLKTLIITTIEKAFYKPYRPKPCHPKPCHPTQTTSSQPAAEAKYPSFSKQLKTLLAHKQQHQENIPQDARENWAGPLPKEFEELLQSKEKYRLLKENNLDVPNGFLLHGKPGNGKTFVVKVLTQRLGIPLIETNSGQFLGAFQGSGNAKLKDILTKAHACKPQTPFKCIIFIDEIDGLQRNRVGIGNGEEDRLMNDLLSAITDPHNSSILFIGATNFIDKIDEALKRSGRLVPVELECPNKETRKTLMVHLFEKHKITLDEHILSMENLLEKTEGLSAADLDAMIKKALTTFLMDARTTKPSFSERLKSLVDHQEEPDDLT